MCRSDLLCRYCDPHTSELIVSTPASTPVLDTDFRTIAHLGQATTPTLCCSSTLSCLMTSIDENGNFTHGGGYSGLQLYHCSPCSPSTTQEGNLLVVEGIRWFMFQSSGTNPPRCKVDDVN
eukprot:749760-Hanusia_phi.AAC.4